MKDLYRNLDIDGPIDAPNLLSKAIDGCADADTARAARYILLNPRRKQVYDRHHRVLSTIGQLRARLALPRSYQWDALGNQDFECETSGTVTDLLDSLDDLDSLGGVPLDASVHRLPSTRYSNPLKPVYIVFGIIAVACVCLLLAIFAVPGPTPRTKSVTLPENGFVDRYVEIPTDSKIKFHTRYGAGHNSVEFVSVTDKRLILTAFVRDGQSATVDVASGTYELRFSVGREKDWNGRRFRHQLRDIEPSEISVRPGKTYVVRIP